MIKHYGLRLSMFLGGCIAALGLFIASFANNIYVVIGAFGFITGIIVILRSPFSLLLGKSVVIQQFWTPNSWKLLVLGWLFNHLLEPLSHLFSRLASMAIFQKYFHIKYHRKTLQNISLFRSSGPQKAMLRWPILVTFHNIVICSQYYALFLCITKINWTMGYHHNINFLAI